MIRSSCTTICVAIALSFSVFRAVQISAQLNCKREEPQRGGDVLHCTTPFIQPLLNLSNIPVNSTVFLEITCTQKNVKSAINSSSFNELISLRKLKIVECTFEDLPEDPFEGVKNLRDLEFTRKREQRIPMLLPSRLSSKLPNLVALTLKSTSIEIIPKTFWNCLPNLEKLSLRGNYVKDLGWLHNFGNSTSTLSDLDLSYNLIRNLPSGIFKRFSSLVTLNIGGNLITSVLEDAFIGLQSLRSLALQGNNLREFPPHPFHHLPNLQHLGLRAANITKLTADVFSGLGNLENLELDNNSVSFQDSEEAPFRYLVNLKNLKLANNTIAFLSPLTFQGLRNLSLLTLDNNDLSNASAYTFSPIFNTIEVLSASYTKSSNLHYLRNFTSLQWLDVSGNSLRQLFFEDFKASKASLSFINLEQTSLQSLVEMDKKWGKNAIFSDIPRLRNLKLDVNFIDRFDYFMIPNGLNHLDVNNNRLNSLEDKFSLRSTKNLRTIDISRNAFKELNSTMFSKSLKVIICNYCKIKIIRQGTFASVKPLKLIEFVSSNIPNIERFAFSLTPGLPMVMPQLLFNSDLCLLSDKRIINNVHFLHFSHGKMICQMTTYCQSNNVKNDKTQYVSKAFLPDSPHFSEFIKLDCGYNEIKNFSVDAFEKSNKVSILYLDGNDIASLFNDTFIHFQALQILFLNNSHVSSLESGVFLDLQDLQKLYLTGNDLQTLNTRQFFGLQKLTHIFLQNNKLSYLDYRVLSGVPGLQYLHLDNNIFKVLNGLAFHSVQGLLNLTLSSNNMTKIGRNSFIELHNLLELNLENNSLSDFSPRFLVSTKQLTTLRLNNNNLWRINEHTFAFTMALEEIYLQHNYITELNVGTLLPLYNLKLLNLQKNSFHSLNGNLFRNTHALKKLYLNYNNLTSIEKDNFVGAFKIEELYLDNNVLTKVNIDALSLLTNLKHLSLHNNELTELAVWKLPPSLQNISVSGNNFPCDCTFLLSFRNWVLSSEGSNKVTDIDLTVCKHRNGTRAELPIVQYVQQYCEPHFSGLLTLLITGGGFITVITICVLMYMHRLEMQVWLYSRYGLRFFYEDNDADVGRMYHAFISYSSDDEEFVAENLVANLEPEFHLCVHGRDFPVGAYITDTVCEVVEKSCRTLLVLSNNFINSEWCRYEFKVAHHQTLKDRCCRLIVILMEDVNVKELDKELKIYLKTNTYLQWGDRFFWEKLRFAMPDIQNIQKQEERQPLLVQ